jgi:hypothetical protein
MSTSDQDEGPRPESRARGAFREALAARRLVVVRGSQACAVALVGIVAAGVVLRLPPAWWVPVVGFVALAGLVFRMLNWTCPACGERLPTRGGRVCLGCGAAIDE